MTLILIGLEYRILHLTLTIMTTIFKLSSIIALSIFCSCANNAKQEESKTSIKNKTEQEEEVKPSTITNTEQEEEVKPCTITNTEQEDSVQAYIDQPEGNESLNDIRFAHWTDNDWYNNDYFKELRIYIDEIVNDSDTDENVRKALSGKFFIGKAEPFLMGGMYIEFIFFDNPSTIYQTDIYSEVDEETRTVLNFSVNQLEVLTNESGYTKDDVLQIFYGDMRNLMW